MAHVVELRRVVDVELDEPADVHVRGAAEAERREGAFDGLALRVEDPLLGPDQYLGAGYSEAAPLRWSHAENGSPVMRSYASR